MDGILMITYYNQRKQRGGTAEEAMFRAASTRMRPLLMTAFRPALVCCRRRCRTASGAKCSVRWPPSIVGGMLVGPIMLLVVVPALRMVFLGQQETHTQAAAEPTA